MYNCIIEQRCFYLYALISQRTNRTLYYILPIEQTSGPLSVLRQAMTEKRTVNVLIRHSAGVRGICTGKVRAFDRHWNIVRTESLLTTPTDHTPFIGRSCMMLLNATRL